MGDIKMNCKLCGVAMGFNGEVIGGCCGHSDGGCCYCDSADFKISYQCNTLKCKQRFKSVIIPELSDQYSIERFFNQYAFVLNNLLEHHDQ